MRSAYCGPVGTPEPSGPARSGWAGNHQGGAVHPSLICGPSRLVVEHASPRHGCAAGPWRPRWPSCIPAAARCQRPGCGHPRGFADRTVHQNSAPRKIAPSVSQENEDRAKSPLHQALSGPPPLDRRPHSVACAPQCCGPATGGRRGARRGHLVWHLAQSMR